jgi:hypothetical protein
LHLDLEVHPLQHVDDSKRPRTVNPVSMTALSYQELLNWLGNTAHSSFLEGSAVEVVVQTVAEQQRITALLPKNTPIQGVAVLQAL